VGRQLPQRLSGDRDVVGGGVRPGVARPQLDLQRFTAALDAVVDERAQRMEPEPTLERRRRTLLLCEVTKVPSMSMLNGPAASIPWSGACSPANSHTTCRAWALAVSIAASAAVTSPASTSMVRDTVASEATAPNTPGSARSSAMSARQSPPTVNDNARSSTTLPGSWIANGLRHGANALDIAASRPLTRTVSVNSTPPACPTAGESVVSTRRCG
jgi:hypothetical protein